MSTKMPVRDSPLFSFKFVNRDEQKAKLTDYLSSPGGKVLWLKGSRSVGSTRLLTECLSERSNIVAYHVRLSENDSMAGLLEVVEKKSGLSFSVFVKKNYKSFATAIKNFITIGYACQTGDLTASSTVHTMLSILEDIGLEIWTTSKTRKSSLQEVIYSYLCKASKKQHIVIALDDFSQCSPHDAEVIGDVVKHSLEQRKQIISFIISTNDEDLAKRNDIERLLYQEIPIQRLELLPWQMRDGADNSESDNFAQMLVDIFDLEGKGATLEYIFNYCKGYPGTLERLVHSFIREYPEALNCNNSALPSIELLKEIIATISNQEVASLQNDGYLLGVITKCIVASRLTWTDNLLRKACEEHGQLSNGGKRIEIDPIGILDAIESLKAYKSFVVFQEGNSTLVRVNDSISQSQLEIAYRKDLRNIPFDGFLKDFLYRNFDMFIAEGFSLKSMQAAYAFCSYNCKSLDYVPINIAYGESCCSCGDFVEASTAFKRIDATDDGLLLEQRINISLALYNAGDYRSAITYLAPNGLEPIDCHYADPFSRAKYLVNLARSKSMFPESKEAAIKSIEKAKLIKGLTAESMLEIENIRQRILTNVGASRNEAREHFLYAKDHYSFLDNSLVYAKLLSSSVEFCRGEIAQKNLAEAKAIAEKCNDAVLLGSVETNIGFDLFWQGKFEKAKECFEDSIEILSSSKIHEISYPLNNLANCYMMFGLFEDAEKHIRRALMWNRSSYADTTLKCALMICLAVQDVAEAVVENLGNELYEKLSVDDTLDVSIRLNVLYNIECAYRTAGIPLPFEPGEAIELAKNTDSNNLPYLWFFGYNLAIEEDIRQRFSENDATGFYGYKFEPWLLTLTHD